MSDDYEIRYDQFAKYIAEQVNPGRVEKGLTVIDRNTAREFFRMMNDFCDNWEKKGAAFDP